MDENGEKRRGRGEEEKGLGQASIQAEKYLHLIYGALLNQL